MNLIPTIYRDRLAREGRRHPRAAVVIPVATLGNWEPSPEAIAVSKAERKRQQQIGYRRSKAKTDRRPGIRRREKSITTHRVLPKGEATEYTLICSRDELADYKSFARSMGMTLSAAHREAMAEYMAAADDHEDWRPLREVP